MGCGKSKLAEEQAQREEAERKAAEEKAAEAARLAKEKEEEERAEAERARLEEERQAELLRKQAAEDEEGKLAAAAAADAAAKAAEEERRRKLPVRCTIVGPPGSTKGKLCELLVAELGCKHVSVGEATRHAVQAGTAAGLRAQEARKAGQQVSDELTLDIVAEHCNGEAVNSVGWILDGFPRTTEQGAGLRDRGVDLSRLIVVGISNEDLVRRATGRRMDLETHTLYHLEGLGFPRPPEDEAVLARLTQRRDDAEDRVLARLDQYREQNQDVSPSFAHVLTVDGAREPQDCVAEIVEFLRAH